MIILIIVLSIIFIAGRSLFKDERDNQLFNNVLSVISVGLIPILSFNWAQEFSSRSVLFIILLIAMTLIQKLKNEKIIIVLITFLVGTIFPNLVVISILLPILIITLNKENNTANYFKSALIILIYVIDIGLLDSILFLLLTLLMFIDQSKVDEDMALERIIPLVLIASTHNFSYLWAKELINITLIFITGLYFVIGSEKSYLRNTFSLLMIFALLLFSQENFVILGVFLVVAIVLGSILSKFLSSATVLLKSRANSLGDLLIGSALSIVPIFVLSLNGATENLFLLGLLFVVIYFQTALFRHRLEDLKDKSIYLLNLIYLVSFFIVFLPFINNDYSWLGLKSLPKFKYSFEIWNLDKALILISLFVVYMILEFAKYKKPLILKKYKFKISFFGDVLVRRMRFYLSDIEQRELVTYRLAESNQKASFKLFFDNIISGSIGSLNFIVWTIVLILTILLVCAI